MTDSNQGAEARQAVKCYACGVYIPSSVFLFSESDNPDRLFCFCEKCRLRPMGKQFGIMSSQAEPAAPSKENVDYLKTKSVAGDELKTTAPSQDAPLPMTEEFAIKWMQICRPYKIGPTVATPETLIVRIQAAPKCKPVKETNV